MRLLLILPVFLLMLAGAGEKEFTAPAEDNVSYTNDVLPILEEKCNIRFCHGERGVPKFNSFRVIRIKAKKIADRITDERNPMPPEDSGITLYPEEIETIKAWVAQGALQN